MSDEEEDYEYHPGFVGECTCDHDEEEHSWGGCMDDCECEAGWEE